MCGSERAEYDVQVHDGVLSESEIALALEQLQFSNQSTSLCRNGARAIMICVPAGVVNRLCAEVGAPQVCARACMLACACVRMSCARECRVRVGVVCARARARARARVCVCRSGRRTAGQRTHGSSGSLMGRHREASGLLWTRIRLALLRQTRRHPGPCARACVRACVRTSECASIYARALSRARTRVYLRACWQYLTCGGDLIIGEREPLRVAAK